MRLIAILARRLREQDGFSMVVVMGLLLIGGMFAIAGWSAASHDIPVAQKDIDQKRAYSAAEAGIDYYLYQLGQNNGYWSNCTNVPPPGPGQPSPVNQPWNGTGSDPRVWRALPNSNAQYTIELIPQNGFTQCSTAQPQQSMLDANTGLLQIRATGRSNSVKRSIVATLRQAGFLDYLYFTDYETSDPIVSGVQNCDVYRRAGRSPACPNIVFANNDVLSGPLHTNDDLLVCGSPTFGRTSADSIEVSAPPQGWAESGACSGAPNFVGTYKTNSPLLSMPQTNSSLSSVAQSQYTFTGTTQIVVNGSSMTVTNKAANLTNASMPLPSNGVIYVKNGNCGTSYQLQQQYNDPSGCADLVVQGTYSQSLTLASENDIIVNGNLLRSGNVTLGLIPNNFIRVYHPVSNCQNAASGPFGPAIGSIEIDAAILSLQHSFIVDNYNCGSPLGTLTVNGAIAQRFRGPVGTGGSQISTGYVKNYIYDDRLKSISPPYFLSPLQSAWQVARFTEQVPAR